jgi:hypothetical protein
MIQMNRHARRVAAATRKKATLQIPADQIDQVCDIQVDGKAEQVVMIIANPKSCKITEDLWPDVEWTTDERLASAHSSDWLFTHIRVTKLPPHLEEKVPLAFASPDALGLAVAMALQRRAEPRRVVHYTGQVGADFKVNLYDGSALANEQDLARTLFAENVPTGTQVGAPESVN